MTCRDCFPFLVEDDDNFALLLQRAFLKAGVPDGNVRRFRDGEETLAHLVSMNAVRPSALVLDVELPGMTGLSMLERVRSIARVSDLPAFVLSGRDDDHFVARAHVLGARAYWVKPFDHGTLQARVRAMLDSLRGDARDTLPGSLLDGK